MDEPTERLLHHFQSLSDAELAQVLQQKREDYQAEALAMAEAEADERGLALLLREEVPAGASAEDDTRPSREPSRFWAYGSITGSLVGLGCYLVYLPAKDRFMMSLVALIPWGLLGVGLLASGVGLLLALGNLVVRGHSALVRGTALLMSVVALMLLWGELMRMG